MSIQPKYRIIFLSKGKNISCVLLIREFSNMGDLLEIMKSNLKLPNS